MAYQVKKQKRVVEDLELLNDKDEVEYTLHVDIAPDVFRNRYIEAMRVIQKVNSLPEDTPAEEKEEAAKDAMMGLFNLVFGEEQTKDLMTYYEGKVFEAVTQITPFIQEVVLPRVTAAIADQRKRFEVLLGGQK